MHLRSDALLHSIVFNTHGPHCFKFPSSSVSFLLHFLMDVADSYSNVLQGSRQTLNMIMVAKLAKERLYLLQIPPLEPQKGGQIIVLDPTKAREDTNGTAQMRLG